MINIHLFNWPQRVAVGCVVGVDVHPSGQYTYPYPIMKLPIVMPQDCFTMIKTAFYDFEIAGIFDDTTRVIRSIKT